MGALPQLRTSGKWIVNADGNVVILRGVNLVSKTGKTPEELGFDARHATMLKERGFNIVRLGVAWGNVEPYLKPDDGKTRSYDTHYLSSLKATIALLAGHGIYTLVDFHQDAYAPPWGFGSPAWAVISGGKAFPGKDVGANTPSLGFPLNTFGGTALSKLLAPDGVSTDLCAAFDAFWSDAAAPADARDIRREGLWTHYGAMLRFVAAFFRDQGGAVAGYDPLNEPTPGSLWTEAYTPPFGFAKGSPGFDAILARFYRECAVPNLRQGHPEAIVWFEPNVLHDMGAKTFLPDLGFDNLGFNFHNYDELKPAKQKFVRPLAEALDYQKSVAAIPVLCSEFGGAGTTDDLVKAAEKVGALNDEAMISSIYWAWFNNPRFNFSLNGLDPDKDRRFPSDPRKQGIVFDLSGDLSDKTNVNFALLDALTRVYPQRVAGTPTTIAFDAGPARVFRLEYTTTTPEGRAMNGSLTTIAVPAALYPDGFDVTVTNGRVVAGDDPGIVTVAADPSPSPATVTAEIRAKGR